MLFFEWCGFCVCGGGGGVGGGVGVDGGELFTCPYPLKVQARPIGDQRLATQSRVSGGFDVSSQHWLYLALGGIVA